MKILKSALSVLGAVAICILLLAAVFPLFLPAVMAQGVGMTLFLTGGSGATGAFGRPIPVPAYLKSVNITTATTTLVKSTPGVLGCVVINTGAAGSATLYNSTDGYNANLKLGTINTATQGMLCYGMIFNQNLAIVTTGTPDLTVTYR